MISKANFYEVTMAQRADMHFDEDFAVEIVGRNIEITTPIKNYIMEKVEKIEKFSTHKLSMKVRLEVQKLDHRVDIVFAIAHTRVAVHALTDNLYASVDKAFDRLTMKLRKWKGRIQEHHAKKLSFVDMQVNVLHREEGDDVEDWSDEIEEQRLQEMEEALAPPQVTKTKTRLLKSLSAEEAAMKMELSNDNFLIFRSEEDQKLKVIYRRRDGSYGIISPE